MPFSNAVTCMRAVYSTVYNAVRASSKFTSQTIMPWFSSRKRLLFLPFLTTVASFYCLADRKNTHDSLQIIHRLDKVVRRQTKIGVSDNVL